MSNTYNKQGTKRRYPLTPQAEGHLAEVLPHVDEKLGGDIKDFVCSLREDIQSDVTIALVYFTNALMIVPVNNHVENAVWRFFLNIKEQIVGFGSKTQS